MPAPRKHFLAIRHKNGGFLPAVKGYGFTRTTPTLTEPPRLFTKPGPCRQALRYWLEGELYEGSGTDDDGQIDLRLIRKPERREEDMEVVEIEIIVRSLSEAELRRL